MPNFYRILGLRPGANSKRVKAAYRRLVKELHPDITAGGAGTEQRVKEINNAYQTLRHPEKRAAYDLDLSRQRAATRWRTFKSLATGVATFILTACSVYLLTLPILDPQQREALPKAERTQFASLDSNVQLSNPSAKPLTPPWQQHVPLEELATEVPPQPTSAKHLRKVENLTPPKTFDGPNVLAPIFVKPALTRDKPTNWVPYHSARLRFALKYPADVFSLAAVENDAGNEHLFLSNDGRALLWISALPNAATTSITAYRQSLMTGRYADASFDYTPEHSHWFVLSGTVGEEMFYERVTFSCDHRTSHRWLVLYPLAERAFFDDIIEEIYRSYRHDLGWRANCGDLEPDSAGARKTPQ